MNTLERVSGTRHAWSTMSFAAAHGLTVGNVHPGVCVLSGSMSTAGYYVMCFSQSSHILGSLGIIIML